jgi:hypothetical protein
MLAAYPTLTAEESCTDHEHTEATFALAHPVNIRTWREWHAEEDL